MRRAGVMLAIALVVAGGSLGLVSAGQPPAQPQFDFSDDIASLRGEKPKESDLLKDLGGQGSPRGDTVIDPAGLAAEFNGSLDTIRGQQEQIRRVEEIRAAEEAERARIAQIEAAQQRAAQLAADNRQSLVNSCTRAQERCENRCSGASDASIVGAFTDALAGTPGRSQPTMSYSSCAKQCRAEEDSCTAAAQAGQGYSPTFKGPSNNSTYAEPAPGGGYGGYAGGGTDTPQCRAAEEEAKRALSRLGKGQGICQSGKDSVAMYETEIRYLNACPAADPTGEQRRFDQQALQQSRDVVRSACN